jgi:hypothetical protein
MIDLNKTIYVDNPQNKEEVKEAIQKRSVELSALLNMLAVGEAQTYVDLLEEKKVELPFPLCYNSSFGLKVDIKYIKSSNKINFKGKNEFKFSVNEFIIKKKNILLRIYKKYNPNKLKTVNMSYSLNDRKELIIFVDGKETGVSSLSNFKKT